MEDNYPTVDDPSKAVDDCLDLFSTTLRSLAADACAIRQIVDIASLVEQGNHTRAAAVEDLRHLDQCITGMEQKVVALRQIINEENAALTRFETTLQEEAEEQAAMIEVLMAAMGMDDTDAENTGAVLRTGTASLRRKPLQPRLDSNRTLGARHSSPHPTKPNEKEKGRKVLQTTPFVGSYPRDLNDDASSSSNETESPPSFVPVTEAELKGQFRIGPNLCRYNVNEALQEIQQIATSKTALQRRQAPLARHWNGRGRRETNLSLRRDGARHGRPDVGTTDDLFWVTEQELRENCAFFKQGELTARATLRTLCSLKRLKQIPNKSNPEVITYLCLF